MIDREKIIQALDICLGNGKCVDCEYHASDCGGRIMRDIIALLQEQEPVCIEYDNSIVLFSCRDCKTQLLYGQRYCHMCGRKIKWK